MSVNWAERQRRTNHLARILANHVFKRRNITPRQLYGLSKLSWITDSFVDDAAGYIKSTKIPALGELFDVDYSGASLSEVAKDIASRVGDSSVEQAICAHTGFTNFYNAYRKSVFDWIDKHHAVLVPMYKDALRSDSENQRLRLIERISELPGISKPSGDMPMRPEYFLTPVFFMLDPKIKFPMINGNSGVKQLLAKLKMTGSGLREQYQAMVGLYGTSGIKDAADLDQVGRDLEDFIPSDDTRATKQLLQTKTAELPVKDESDVEVIRKATSSFYRRLHNELTNKLQASLPAYTLFEGKDPECMFDVLVKDYDDDGHDLLIEVKSSTEVPHVRMAIGQLYDYCMRIKSKNQVHLAVLLPGRPDDGVIDLLEWLKIGLMWYEREALCTASKWLSSFVERE